MDETKKVFLCVQCGNKFSVIDAETDAFFIKTYTCLSCYESMQRAPYTDFCFGKQNAVVAKTLYYGFNLKSFACSQVCSDRVICQMFVERKNDSVQS